MPRSSSAKSGSLFGETRRTNGLAARAPRKYPEQAERPPYKISAENAVASDFRPPATCASLSVEMTLLQKRAAVRRERRLSLYEATRAELGEALHAMIPGEPVWLFGSITQPGRFNDASDIDLALEREPAGVSSLALSSELAERLRRRVDVVLLSQCRWKEKILREGELWTR
ncbi:MAG: nucleotidyltransferase domain-containing protein [Chthoniobacterales bacterium]|nr:nucleotidyltransferase domain-containing protein [Chthoniobacterales bacterium]